MFKGLPFEPAAKRFWKEKLKFGLHLIAKQKLVGESKLCTVISGHSHSCLLS